MKKTAFLFLFTILLSSCAPQVVASTSTPTVANINSSAPTITNSFTPTVTQTLKPTLTATATRIPCPPIGSPATFGEIRVVFHENVPDDACDLIQLYVSLTNKQLAAMGYATGPIEVAVFATFDAATDYTYETARLAGCNPDSKDIIRAGWIRGGAMSTRGAVFLLNGKWGAKYDLASAIAHEITQATMTNILGSCQRRWQVPDWYAHGLAEYHAETFTLEWGLTPWDEDLYKCQYKLSHLNAGEECIYMEAQMAFHLLRLKYDKDKGLEVIIQMGKGKSFNQAFYDVYKISVSAFSDEFDTYRLNGYKLIEPTPTP